MKIYFFVQQNMIYLYINLICISYERNYSKLITILCGIDWMLLCSWTHAEESKRKGEWWKECLMEFQRIWKLNATISNADVLWMSDLWLTSNFQNLYSLYLLIWTKYQFIVTHYAFIRQNHSKYINISVKIQCTQQFEWLDGYFQML